MVQPSYQLFGYDAAYQDKNNGNKDMGFFTINRSADVYVYGVHDKTDWIVSKGYEKLGDEYKVTRTQNTVNPSPYYAYKKRFVVPEGETKTITTGGATSLDGTRDSYYMIVDFINPVSFVDAKSIKIDGVGYVELKEDVYEYEFVVMESIYPDIECELSGVGATYNYTVAENENGQTATVVLTSGDGTSTVEYKLHFVDFSKALTEINVDGVLVEGFDKDVYDYNYELPFGVNQPKTVEAAVLSHPDIKLIINQATVENPVATVTVKNIVTEEELVYTVTFAPSNKTTITPAISYLGSSTSACDKLSKNAYQFAISIYDNSITMNFMKIDISSLKNQAYINENSKFTLNINAKMQRNLQDSNGTGLDEVTVKALSLPDIFNWDAEVTSRATNTYTGTKNGSDYKNYVDGKTPIGTTMLPFLNSSNGKNDFNLISLDVTSAIYDAIQGEGNYAYIALAGNPAELKLNQNVKNITFYYYAIGSNAPTLTLEIND